MSIFTKIGRWFVGLAKKVAEALSIGIGVANTVKSVVDSPLLDIAVNLTPTNIDNEALGFIRAKLPAWIKTMGWAEKKVSDFDETTLPHVLNAVAAEASKIYADYKKVDLSRQQAIAGAQVVYNPDIIK